MGIGGWPMTGRSQVQSHPPLSVAENRRKTKAPSRQVRLKRLKRNTGHQGMYARNRFCRHRLLISMSVIPFLAPNQRATCEMIQYIYLINLSAFLLGPLRFLPTHFVLESSRAWCLFFSSSPLLDVCPIAGRLCSPTVLQRPCFNDPRLISS
jgi:hypothetical protein